MLPYRPIALQEYATRRHLNINFIVLVIFTIIDSSRYAHKRETFGKRLVDHPVIRAKLAHMARQIEATHAWLETTTQQLKVCYFFSFILS